MTKDEAKQKVTELVAKYQNMTLSEIKKQTEEATKQGFILPLFKALGWDVEDSTNEVVPEEKASGGRVDYAFKINKVARLYVEAKPLKADLNNPDYVKQAITYAYNNGVTWAILTNFEELRLFNAQNNKPFIQLNCKDFVTGFDKLWLLSRVSVAADLNKEATQYGALPLAIPIEEKLFKQLRQWRENLFNELYHYNNEWLKEKQIDEVIQKLFNRLIFIRTAEDRKLEDKLLLAAVHQNKNGLPLSNLQEIFQHYRGYYDSDLFETHILDSDRLYVHELTLNEILNGLYQIPSGIADYDFSIISADVLGRVYEQYLGYMASAVKEKAKAIQAKLDLGLKADTEFEVTAKKQRRKEQGIFYTPQFVTDYIVNETVGRFIKENEAAAYDKILKMKILDPACGSGSFLIRAYDELLNYHAKVRGKAASQMEQADRMPILTRNIFGVDLDHQAVEIARLNLLLRGLAKRDLLPPLTDNIRQGNSLISGTEKELKGYFGKDWKDKHPFNWQDEFKDIMQAGGFDVVIGNPPYVNESRGNKAIFRDLKAIPYLAEYYEKNMDLFNYFIEVGIDLLKEGGLISFIIPAYWQDRTGATYLRNKIFNQTEILNLLELKEFKVFEDAPGQHNNIFVLRKTSKLNKNRCFTYMQITSNKPLKSGELPPLTNPQLVEYSLINNKLIIGEKSVNLIVKLNKGNVFHLSKEQIMRGVDTSPSTHEGDGVFVLDSAEYNALKKGITQDVSDDFFKPFYEANQINRYHFDPNNRFWLLYTDNRRKNLLKKGEEKYSAIVKHIDKYSKFITSSNKPYGLHRPKKEETFVSNNKVMFIRKSPYPKFVAVPIPYFVDESVYMITPPEPYDQRYLLSIFNSKLSCWWFMNQKKHGNQLQIDKEQILAFPIHSIDFDSPSDKDKHNLLVNLSENMLELNKKLAPIRETYSSEREELVKEIEKTDREIDNLVYDLYGITEAERKIVEANI